MTLTQQQKDQIKWDSIDSMTTIIKTIFLIFSLVSIGLTIATEMIMPQQVYLILLVDAITISGLAWSFVEHHKWKKHYEKLLNGDVK